MQHTLKGEPHCLHILPSNNGNEYEDMTRQPCNGNFYKDHTCNVGRIISHIQMFGIWAAQPIQSPNTLLCLRACSMRARHAVASLLSFKFFKRPENHEAKRGLGVCKLEENQVTSLRNDNLSENEVRHPKYTTQSGNPKIDHRNYQSIGGQTQFWHLAMNHQWILGLHGFTSSLILKTQLGILSYIYIYITWG